MESGIGADASSVRERPPATNRTEDDEGDSSPALRANVFMQADDREQDDDHTAARGCRENVAEIGKRKRNRVATHEDEKRKDSKNNEGIGEGTLVTW